MKKLSIVSMIGVAAICALALTGCPSVHSDLDVALAPEYIVGTPTAYADQRSGNDIDISWGDAHAEPLTYTDGKAEFSFTYQGAKWGEGDGNLAFKFGDAASSSGLSPEYGPTNVTASTDDGFTWDLSGGNIVVKGLTVGNKYTITVTVKGAKPELSLTSTDGSASSGSVPADIEDADVSVLNSTTATQAGAYLKLEGTSAGDTTGSVYAYFYGGTTATAYFETGDEFADWGKGEHFAAWFKFYAGDGTTLGIDSKQLGAGSTTLGTAISITNANKDNLEVTDLTAAGTYKMVVNTTADGATITITKVE